MEVAEKKPCNGQQKNKPVVKIGGGGGIGAVILLGGALATAALASAFLVRKKGRSSGEERRRSHRDSSPELIKQNGGDEVGDRLQFVPSDASSDAHNKHSSDEATKEVKLENGTGLLVATRNQILDEKPGILVNGYDAETTEQISTSTSPRAVSDHGPVMIKDDSHPSDEKPAFELEKVVNEEEIRLTEQDVTNESLKASDNAKRVCVEGAKAELEHKGCGVMEPMNHREVVEITATKLVDDDDKCCDQDESEAIVEHNGVEGVDIDKIEVQKNADMEEKEFKGVLDIEQLEAQKNVNVRAALEENEAEGCIRGNGETVEEKCDEGIEKAKGNVGVLQQELSHGTEESVGTDSSRSETVVSESLIEEKQRGNGSIFESPVIKQESVNGDAKEGAMPTEVVEMIQEDASLEGSRKDQINAGEKELEGRCSENGDVNKEKCGNEAIENTKDDMHTVVSESHVEDERIALQSVFQNPVLEHVIVSGEEKEGGDVLTEVAEMIQQDEAIEGGGGGEEEDQMEHSNEGQMIKEQNEENEEIAVEVTKDDGVDEEIAIKVTKDDGADEEIVTEVTKDDGADEEIAIEVIKDDGAREEIAIEVTKDDGANEEIAIKVTKDDGADEDIAIEVTKDDGADEKIARSLDVSESKISTPLVSQPKDDADHIETTNPTESDEGQIISPEVIEVKQEDGQNKEVSEQLKINEIDAQGDVVKEVDQGLISPEKAEVKEANIGNEEIAESLEASEEKISVDLAVSQVYVGSSEAIDTGVAAAKDSEIVEMSEDSIKDYLDETDSSEEIEEISTGESSVEFNGEAVWPAESLDESNTKLLDQEVHGKTLEDKADALKESDSRIGFAKGAGNLDRPILFRKDFVGNATRWRIIIATLSVVSSLSCSWLFGLSPVKMCLIVSLAMVLSKIQGY